MADTAGSGACEARGEEEGHGARRRRRPCTTRRSSCRLCNRLRLRFGGGRDQRSAPLWLSFSSSREWSSFAAIAGLLAVRFARKAALPKPVQAIEEAERTVEELRSHV